MTRKASKFMVGLFTTLGVVIGVVAIIWIGACCCFRKMMGRQVSVLQRQLICSTS